jgi:hypothetical protein
MVTNLNTWLTFYIGPAIIILLVLVLALIGILIWTAIRMGRLERHYTTLTAGTDGGNLVAVLEDHVGQVRLVDQRVQALDEAVHALEADGCRYIQHLGFLRFNPFRETGGDQSFSLALADGQGDGTVISTLHSRDLTRVYAKPLKAWQSTYQLTEEEETAIKKARDI